MTDTDRMKEAIIEYALAADEYRCVGSLIKPWNREESTKRLKLAESNLRKLGQELVQKS